MFLVENFKMKAKIFTMISAITLISAAIFIGVNSYKTQQIDDYISITTQYTTTYDEKNDYAKYGATIYEYNLKSKEISEIFSFPDNTQYPLGVYDKKTHSVYYVKEKNNDSFKRKRTGDQIYVYSLETGSDTMLTEDVFAVNYIVPVDDTIFFFGCERKKFNSRQNKLI
ncbi:hypothetical protein [Tissierella sp.]|uniref:hypothetical protein n=1 Tax=Tissierella sp. TaxID=41274 RepID=UPI0028A77187|nr:hypothetical protein [Tissierella sp.]